LDFNPEFPPEHPFRNVAFIIADEGFRVSFFTLLARILNDFKALILNDLSLFIRFFRIFFEKFAN